MAKVAGVGAACVECDLDVRAADGVAANGFEQAVSGVRHVAVVAKAPGGVGKVMGVRVDGILDFRFWILDFRLC